MPTEETLVLVKPDGVARGLTGAILARIEAKGYALVDIKLVEPDRDLLAAAMNHLQHALRRAGLEEQLGKAHRQVDPLKEPGHADLTQWADFPTVQAAAREADETRAASAFASVSKSASSTHL